ncbi:MAG: hypothetical protein IJK81_06940 [Selenomonadaceae bacterium]|nr:hypothetical protein [Selenomonadaceae bacterium]
MNTYYNYNVESTQSVSETLTISGGQVQLRNIPRQGSVTISGFIETTSLVVDAGKFRVDYFDANGEYREASRKIYFNSADNGKRVSVGYSPVGTPVTAADMNEIKAHMENSTLHGGSGSGIGIGVDYIGSYDSFPTEYDVDYSHGSLIYRYDEQKFYLFDANVGEWLPFKLGGGAGISTTVDSSFWTAYGSPTIQDGALYLNQSSYLRSNLQYYTWQWLSEPFTLDIDFKTSTKNRQMNFIDTTYKFYLYITAQGYLELNLYDDDYDIIITTPDTVNDGAWHHARVEFDGAADCGYSSSVRLFCDDSLIGSGSDPDIHWRNDSLFVGRDFIGSLKNLVVNGPNLWSSHGQMYAVFSDRFDKVNWS